MKNFIVFEGLDGSGTTTQARLLADAFKNGLFTKEPTDSSIGKFIREILKGNINSDQYSLPYLFLADRINHIKEITNEIVTNGKKVICDRYFFSSIAYQSLDMNFEKIVGMNADFVLPEILYFIDTPVDICMERIQTREKAEIFEKRELLEKVRTNYFKAFDHFNNLNLVILDGTKSIKELLAEEINIIHNNISDYEF